MNICISELPKKPTSMQFTADGQIILVSDKFGDVFRQVRPPFSIALTHFLKNSYPFIIYVPLTVKQQRDAHSSHENPSGGQLILGHASPLNAFLLTNDEKYIVTADRDEHIRVSWYPKGYNIEMYCLGHLKYGVLPCSFMRKAFFDEFFSIGLYLLFISQHQILQA